MGSAKEMHDNVNTQLGSKQDLFGKGSNPVSKATASVQTQVQPNLNQQMTFLEKKSRDDKGLRIDSGRPSKESETI